MIALQLSLLGTFDLRWHNQHVTTFPTDKVRALLAYLALEAHSHPLRRESLATLLWPDYPDNVALRNLRQNLHRLKQLLDNLQPGLSEQVLQVTRQTVQVDTRWLAVDVHQFTAALTAVEKHPHDHVHTCAPCLQQLTQAANLLRGDLLAGLTLPDAPNFDEWLTIQREQIHYDSLNLLYILAESYIQQGDYERAHSYAMRQINLEPWREEAQRQLMIILSQQGRRNEALLVYEHLLELLQAELGIGPSQETEQLYRSLLNSQTAGSQLHHFTTAVTPFLGREQNLSDLSDLLFQPDCRLITITGLGGMGKTRLAQQLVQHLADTQPVALHHRFPAGCYFVPLETVNQADLLWEAIAQQIGLNLPSQEPSRVQLLNHLQEQAVLLVLDNLELLAPEFASRLADLLRHTSRLQLIATSRVPLQLAGEWVYPLAGLTYQTNQSDQTDALDDSVSTAVHLFVQTARRVRPNFQPTMADREAIQAICTLTEGLPLAIEMAASWVRVANCATIARQMRDNLDMLSSPWRHQPARQKSMRLILDYAWQALTPEAQETLLCLTLFQGTFSLTAITAVLPHAWPQIAQLHDHFLLQQTTADDYYFHPLVRRFAEEKGAARLAAGQDNTAVRDRYTHYYLTLLAEQAAKLTTAEAAQARQQLRADWVNVGQAWENAIAARAWDLLSQAAEGLVAHCTSEGLVIQGESWFTAVLEALPPSSYIEETVSTRWYIQWQRARLFLEDEYQRAEQLLTAIMDPSFPIPVAYAPHFWNDYAISKWRLGKLEEAEPLFRQVIALAVARGEAHPAAQHHLANLYLTSAPPNEACWPLYAQALQTYRQRGHLAGEAGVLHDYGLASNVMGDKLETSISYVQQSLHLYQLLHHQYGATMAASNLVYLLLLSREKGQYEEAISLGTELLNNLVGGGKFMALRAQVHVNLGHLYQKQKRHGLAAYHYRQVLGLFDHCHHYKELAGALVGWGHLLVGALASVEQAALIMGLVQRLADGNHLPDLFEQEMKAETMRLLADKLDPDQLAHLIQQGAALSIKELLLIQTVAS